MEVRIRPGADSDAKAVAALHTASWRTAYAEIMPEEYLNGPLERDHQVLWLTRLTVGLAEGDLFVAESGQALVGFIYLSVQPDGRVLIDNLHVEPSLKRAGIGGAVAEVRIRLGRQQIPRSSGVPGSSGGEYGRYRLLRTPRWLRWRASDGSFLRGIRCRRSGNCLAAGVKRQKNKR